jgi:spore maturation protein CgeB
MRIALFCHSLLSDWNHGSAHFLRGVVTELAARGHAVRTFESASAWSAEHLLDEAGDGAPGEVQRVYPALAPTRYDLASLDLDQALADVDLVIVHEWNDPELVRRVGAHRARTGTYRAFFHDTHHRAVTEPESVARLDLGRYDGVLAFGRSLRDVYLARGFAQRIFVWHEAADARVFTPRRARVDRDLVWIGNHSDGERRADLEALFVGPVRALGLTARVHGVRYPAVARAAFGRAGIELAGRIPNHLVPEALARARATLHIPRRPYVESLPGIPTIRVFEALACGAPLVVARFRDDEGLFAPGLDFLPAETGRDMTRALGSLLSSPERARALAEHGRATVLARHTCAHRVDELLAIHAELSLR